MTNPQYSEKELKLIKQLGYMDLLSVEPIALYRIIAMNLFKQNKTGVLVDSVRMCLNAIDNGTPHRLTKEFDDLIVLEVQSVSYWDDPEKYPYFVGN